MAGAGHFLAPGPVGGVGIAGGGHEDAFAVALAGEEAAVIEGAGGIDEDALALALAGKEGADIFVAIGESQAARPVHQPIAPLAGIGKAGIVEEFAAAVGAAVAQRAAILRHRAGGIVGGGAGLAEAQRALAIDGAGGGDASIVGQPLQVEAERGDRIPDGIADALELAGQRIPHQLHPVAIGARFAAGAAMGATEAGSTSVTVPASTGMAASGTRLVVRASASARTADGMPLLQKLLPRKPEDIG